MNKNQLVAKIHEAISGIDEMASLEGKRTTESSVLKECRADLQQLLDELQSTKHVVDPAKLIVVVYKLVERLASWTR